MIRLKKILVGIVLLLLLTGCGKSDIEDATAEMTAIEPTTANDTVESDSTTVSIEQPDVQQTEAAIIPLTLSEDEFPRMNGSTATIPLGEAIASVIMEKDRADCEQYAQFTGTSDAYMQLVDGNTDFLVVYEPSETTKEYIKESGVDLEYVPIGKDALVFLVNNQNLVNGLSTQQIKDIYSGEVTNWKDIGGTDSIIKPYQRNESAGSQALMVKLVMGETPFMKGPEIYLEATMEGVVTAISAYNNGEFAIGYNVYYYVTKMKEDDNIKLLAIDGIMPEHQTIADGQYPFVNDFYAVIRKDAPKDSSQRMLFEWLQSAEAKALIDLEGYVAQK